MCRTPMFMAALATALLAPVASAAVMARAGPAPSPWVTVDANGHALTVTPSVVSGSSSTVSAPPSYLTQTGVYTLTADGRTSTSTGLPPVASPTGSGLAGAFLACNSYQAPGSPFCQPRKGSQMYQGKTYYITWDPTYFGKSTTSTMVEVQAEYGTSGIGFTSISLPASQGYYIWTIDPSLLQSQKASSFVNVTLFLGYTDTTSAKQQEILVPKGGVPIAVTSAPPSGPSGPSAVAVAVPVIVAVVLLGLVGFCCWSWRKHGRLPLVGGALAAAKRRSGAGYGVRQSHSQRTGTGTGLAVGAGASIPSRTKGGAGIQLTPSDSWSPTSGRNVFREEINRQDRETR